MSERIHKLKTWTGAFGALWRRIKTYEIRKNDRDYRVGDRLQLQEWDETARAYCGREILAEVTYMTPGGQWGLPPDLCVLAIKEISRDDAPSPEPTR